MYSNYQVVERLDHFDDTVNTLSISKDGRTLAIGGKGLFSVFVVRAHWFRGAYRL